MLDLAKLQQRTIEQMIRLRRSTPTPPACLVYGPSGAGKRTTVRGLANSSDLQLVEVNVADNPRNVRRRLFGNELQTNNTDELGIAPGECGADEGMVLYLTGFEKVDPELHQELHRLITRRQYLDALGRFWHLHDSTWVIASIAVNSMGEDVTIMLGHWLSSAFSHSIPIDVSADSDDVALVCSNIAKEFGRAWREQSDEPLSQAIQAVPDRLSAVRRWITKLAFSTDDNTSLGFQELQKELLLDVGTLLAKMPYRGHVLTTANFEKWAMQFGPHRSLATTIIQHIADRYYISERDSSRGLDRIISQSDIPKQAEVIFCTWQSEGNSAPRIAHQVKNQAQWKASRVSIDLRVFPVDVNDLDEDEEHLLVLFDDFSGSGRTIAKLFKGEKAPLPQVLNALPRARVVIGVIAAYLDAMQKVLKHAAPFSDRIKLVPYRVFDEKDKCFSEQSQIFPDSETRLKLRELCRGFAKEYFSHMTKRDRFGYGGVGSLVVFPDTVPNNSLPAIWYNNSTDWSPLFPASGLPSSLESEIPSAE